MIRADLKSPGFLWCLRHRQINSLKKNWKQSVLKVVAFSWDCWEVETVGGTEFCGPPLKSHWGQDWEQWRCSLIVNVWLWNGSYPPSLCYHNPKGISASFAFSFSVDRVPMSEMIKLHGLYFIQSNRLSLLQGSVREFNHKFTTV